ncbi:hypothetical protein GCM10007973_02980 [Polymorphobacter multimanifer]|uniref:TraB/GumN family protein n=1 Tax=Polymorphobacter multimanifer TaxID=1070431 RepID=A0A841LBY8_9SPHN|nr:TraB/GumN family protein [Polymorphobacter multimanifer]MBB6226662.1 hypothetical protein [Polymorphobacter multimanifer]GGI69261.1 hypothetical protein GCM10007973_02980 [Polymorphobacter multimanifer]
MIRLLLALLLLLAAPISAQPAVPPPARAQPPVWVIRDADTELTLFATVHALPAGVDWFSPEAQRRFDAAGRLIVETKLPDDRFALAPIIEQLGIDANLPPLKERLDAATYATLAKTAAELRIPMPALDRMRPWLVSITLGEAVLTRAGVSAGAGVEVALLARAAKQDKPLVALESAQEQLGFFAGLPEADQKAMLTSTLTDIPEARAEVAAMVALWQKGDMDGIARDFASEAKASPKLHEVLLAGRNRRWAHFLVSEMARPGKSFLAVGAGHFGGPDGLLALLAARGFPAQRLPLPTPPPKSRRR